MIRKNTPAAWLSEVNRRADRLKAALATGKQDAAQKEARELAAAAQILAEEIVCSRTV